MAGALPNDAFGPLGSFKAAPYLTEGEAGMSAYYSTMVVDTCRRSGRGCPWDEMTCSEAAGSGHMAVLQWARQQGCPWDGRTWIAANRMGHVDVLQWAEQNGCPHDPDVRLAREPSTCSCGVGTCILGRLRPCPRNLRGIFDPPGRKGLPDQVVITITWPRAAPLISVSLWRVSGSPL